MGIDRATGPIKVSEVGGFKDLVRRKKLSADVDTVNVFRTEMNEFMGRYTKDEVVSPSPDDTGNVVSFKKQFIFTFKILLHYYRTQRFYCIMTSSHNT